MGDLYCNYFIWILFCLFLFCCNCLFMPDIIRLMCNVRMGGCVCEKESISVYIFHVMYIIYTYVSLDIYLLYLYVCIHMYTFFYFFFVYLCKCLNKLYKKTNKKQQQLFNTTINTHA